MYFRMDVWHILIYNLHLWYQGNMGKSLLKVDFKLESADVSSLTYILTFQ